VVVAAGGGGGGGGGWWVGLGGVLVVRISRRCSLSLLITRGLPRGVREGVFPVNREIFSVFLEL